MLLEKMARLFCHKMANQSKLVQKRQQQLISVGAKITADGVTGPSTRKAEAEFGKLIPVTNKK